MFLQALTRGELLSPYGVIPEARHQLSTGQIFFDATGFFRPTHSLANFSGTCITLPVGEKPVNSCSSPPVWPEANKPRQNHLCGGVAERHDRQRAFSLDEESACRLEDREPLC